MNEEVKDLSRAKSTVSEARINVPIYFDPSIQSEFDAAAWNKIRAKVQEYATVLHAKSKNIAISRKNDAKAIINSNDIELAAARHHEHLHEKITDERLRVAILFALLSVVGSATVQLLVTSGKRYFACIVICFTGMWLIISRTTQKR